VIDSSRTLTFEKKAEIEALKQHLLDTRKKLLKEGVEKIRGKK
jgi:hypothetical protein